MDWLNPKLVNIYGEWPPCCTSLELETVMNKNIMLIGIAALVVFGGKKVMTTGVISTGVGTVTTGVISTGVGAATTSK